MIEPGLDSPQCLEVGRFVTRADRAGPEHEWFDPNGYSYLWAAPFYELETVGGTPRMGAGKLALSKDDPTFVRPLRLVFDMDELERLPEDTEALGLPGLDDDLAAAVAKRFELRRLFVAPAGELTKKGLKAIASLTKLTHLVLPHELGDGALDVLSKLSGLRVLVCQGTGADAASLKKLAKLEALEVLALGDLDAKDKDLGVLEDVPLRAIDFARGGAITGSGLRGWKALRDLTIRGVDAKGLEAIVELQLEHLDLELGGAEEVDVTLLGQVKTLRSLSAPAAYEPLDWIAKLRDLRRLRLQRRSFRGPSLEPLGSLEHLVELCLPDSSVKDDELEPLAGLKELRALDLKSSMVTGRGLKHLAKLPRFERLNLFNNIYVDAPGLAEVAKLPALRVLNLGSCMHPFEDEQRTGLTDAGVAKLAKCKALRLLNVSGNVITPAAVKKVRKALPGCKVIAGYMVKRPFGDVMEEAKEALASGDLDAAEKGIERCAKEYPDMPAAHELAAELLVARRDLQGALAALDRVIDIDPTAEAFSARADARSKARDHEGAAADYRKALEADPSKHDHHLRVAEACFDGGDHAGAVAGYTALIDLCVRGEADARVWGQHSGALLTNRGCALLEMKKYAAAIADFDAAIGVEPKASNNWGNRAEARFKDGDFEAAIADAEHALELDPANATAKEYLAAAKKKLRR